MAKPIALEIAPRDPKKELLAKLEAAPLEHATAILDSFELLHALHDAGVLEMLRGAITAKDQLVETAVSATKSAEAIHALRNALILGKVIGSINPELLQCIANAVGETLGSERRPVIEPPGLFSLLGQFRRPELRRSLALLNQFLETLGTRLKEKGCTPGTQS